MDKTISSLILSFLVGIMIFGMIGIVMAENDNNNSDNGLNSCKNLYWIDNENKDCSQKEFCGAFMYYGLQTFEKEKDCLKSINKTEKENKNKHNKFQPWQKRNESECPDGCKCRGAVVTCETEDGKTMTIESGNSGKITTIEINKIKVNTTLEFETNSKNNKTKIILNLPDGRNITLKVLPEDAANKLKEKLGEMNYTIELKQTTITKNNQTKIVYEIIGEKHGKFLGLFKTKGKIISEVDAETGEVVKIKKPWGFLVKEDK